MFPNPSFTPIIIAIIGLVGTVLVGFGLIQSYRIGLYQDDIAEMRKEHEAKVLIMTKKNTVTASNLVTCKATILEQNNVLDAMNIEYEHRLANFKPKTIVKLKEKLKVVYRDRNISKKECDEVFSSLDAIEKVNKK